MLFRSAALQLPKFPSTIQERRQESSANISRLIDRVESTILITNASGIHARSISQYCVATLLTLYHALDKQIVHARVRTFSFCSDSYLKFTTEHPRMDNERDVCDTGGEVLRGDSVWEDDRDACTYDLDFLFVLRRLIGSRRDMVT